MNVNVLVSTSNMQYKDWIEFRRKGIGGSDVAAVCGISKWKSPMEVWLDKTGQLSSSTASEAAYWGTLMEPLVRDEFSARTGLKVKPIHAILQHKRFPFMLANLDGVVSDPSLGEGIFEAKTASAYRASEWETGIPDEYILQVQHYMAVTGFDFAYIAVLIGGNKFLWKLLERDEAIIDLLIQMEHRFWQLVLTGIMPEMDGSPAASELLNRLYPISNPKTTIDLPESAAQWLAAYEEAYAQEQQAANRKEQAVNLLKQALGDHEIGIAVGKTVSWKTVNTDRLDTKAFKAEHPDLYGKYVKNSSYRRFAIK